ncbi:relaxase/mobilization nuclease domain-containing protein [Rhodobacter sp. 24-YEA-8]|uniref:relaxase/mobilization nuclease domain-containing protein n=1 Tax=Rhodobacter sp. 24-YEA-8 TaxID=1884310 RepID=UPI00089A0175|nr:relaxase/mobilization nuclease domain-containing protein [Rhodobacter sp. 24-YEA-8]SED45677.1 Relaxase/Mobilisation nuclease domain-containing protein [Rhodobacter sp. 24-YEA-8]
MIAKSIRDTIVSTGSGATIPRRDLAARIRYVCSKASSTGTLNLAGDWRDAAAQMQTTAGLNERVRQPVKHIILSWPETDKVSDAQAIQAARMMNRACGAAGHQQVIGVHRDRINTHVHILLNRVHPISGKTLSLSQDYARMERACREIERQMGWSEDRGRFDAVVQDGHVKLLPKPAAHWRGKVQDREMGLRPDGRGTRGCEQRTGLASLRDRIPAEIRRRLCAGLERASDWQALHCLLARAKLVYLRHRSGGRILDQSDGSMMAASALGAAWGLARLTARFGPFAFAPEQEPRPQPAIARYRGAAPRRAELKAILGPLGKIRRDIAEWRKAQWLQTGRYRHLLRRAREGGSNPPRDLTAVRQIWCQPIAQGAGMALPEPMRLALQDCREDLRFDGRSEALMARRSRNGSIIGFDRLSTTAATPQEEQIPPGSVKDGAYRGIGLIGPRDAPLCLLVPDLFAAVSTRLMPQGASALIIATGRLPQPGMGLHLLQLIGQRGVVLCCGSDPQDQRWAEQMRQLLPRARRHDLAIRALWHAFVSGGAGVAPDTAVAVPAAPRPDARR